MLTGYTAEPDFLKLVTWISQKHDDRVLSIQRVVAFHYGSRYLVEVELVLPADMTVREARDLSEALQLKIERISDVEMAFVHIGYKSKWHNREPRASIVAAAAATNDIVINELTLTNTNGLQITLNAGHQNV